MELKPSSLTGPVKLHKTTINSSSNSSLILFIHNFACYFSLFVNALPFSVSKFVLVLQLVIEQTINARWTRNHHSTACHHIQDVPCTFSPALQQPNHVSTWNLRVIETQASWHLAMRSPFCLFTSLGEPWDRGGRRGNIIMHLTFSRSPNPSILNYTYCLDHLHIMFVTRYRSAKGWDCTEGPVKTAAKVRACQGARSGDAIPARDSSNGPCRSKMFEEYLPFNYGIKC